jgi:uncharacterized protein
MNRVEKVKIFVIDNFFTCLPDGLYYHDLAHTLDVFEASKRIALAEQLTENEIELLQVAALFHDTGYIESYENNEDLGAGHAVSYLPDFGFNEAEIAKIKGAILATNLGIPPLDLFEMVLCDADLDYLGRDDFHFRSNLLYEEFMFWGVIHSKEEWNTLQRSFLAVSHYFTSYSLKNRAPVVAENLKKLLNE